MRTGMGTRARERGNGIGAAVRRRAARWADGGVRAAVAVAAGVALAACASGPVAPEGTTLFVVEVSGERFRVAVRDAAQVEAFEARRASGVQGVIIGSLVAGDGGFNRPWSWHLDPDDAAVADLAIELCDGRPSMVEDDLGYWLGSVEQFCPWGATVVSRE